MTRISEATDPAASAVAVVPNDATVLDSFRSLYVGGAGDVAILPENDLVSVIFLAVPAGSILPVFGTKVLATGTTATNIVALR